MYPGLRIAYHLFKIYGHAWSILGHSKQIVELLQLLLDENLDEPDL